MNNFCVRVCVCVCVCVWMSKYEKTRYLVDNFIYSWIIC